MLAAGLREGQEGRRGRPLPPVVDRSRRMGGVEEARFKLMAGTFFGEKEIARFSTLEVAEVRASELNEHTERNPRGYAQYVVRPVEGRSRDEGSI